MSKNLNTNVFATTQDPALVDALIKVGVELMSPAGVLAWSKVEAACGTDIGYARGWLIVRRAYLEAKQAELLVPIADMVKAARAKAEAAGNLSTFDEVRTVLAPVVGDLKDSRQLSWGEIMCRTGLTEGKVRAAYRATGAKKDKGIRNGRGGRFAYSDPTLYLANRKSEGAHIPADYKGRPMPEQLLNFVPVEGQPAAKKAAPARKAPAAKATTTKAKATPKAAAKAS